jgi:arylsulfatase A
VSTIYGMISVMDAGVGRILETLALLGLGDNTIVMFTSDNGPQFGGRGEACTTRFNCGFNGSKSFVYEGGIRVPMILRWPEGLGGQRSVHEMIHFCDWLPTLLAAAGVEIPRELALDGCDVLPVLRGQTGDVPTRRFWQWNRYQPEVTSNAAMRDGDWKLVRPAITETFWTDPEEQKLDSAYRDEPWREFEPITGDFPARTFPEPPPPELFNIAADPLERRDLAPDHPSRVTRMLRNLEAWFEDVEADRAAAGGPW